jgi:splicing suppressor protein 51
MSSYLLFLLALEIATTVLQIAIISTNIMRREQIAKEEGTLIVAFSLLAVRGHLCFRCLLHSAKLSKCRGYRRALYGGKSYQALD